MSISKKGELIGDLGTLLKFALDCKFYDLLWLNFS